jgi:hypothetical protein
MWAPVTLLRVEQHWRVHACPAFPAGHAWSITRTVLDTTPSGLCLTPLAVPATDCAPARTAACADRLPSHRRCPNCTVTIAVARISLHVEVTTR